MGMIDQAVLLHRAAFALLLGFTLMFAFVLAYMSGREKQDMEQGHARGPLHDYGHWVKEAHGPVPAFLKLWIIFIAAAAVTLTGIVMYHGYWY